jgi:pilus assembly protein Flp/PilA
VHFLQVFSRTSCARLTAEKHAAATVPRVQCDIGAAVVELSSISMEKTMRSLISRFVEDTSGATAIEYGLIAAGIAVAIIAVVQGVGTKLTATFQSVSDNLK